MKILHITKKYPDALGGDATVVYNLERQQVKEGHQVFILAPNCEEIVNRENLQKFGLRDVSTSLDRITLRRILSLVMLGYQGHRYIRKIRPDVIHSHSADLGFVISFSSHIQGVPIIDTLHIATFNNMRESRFKRFFERFFLKHGRFKRIITVDKTSLKSFDAAGIDNVTFIPNGVDLELFSPRPANKVKEKVRFLFVGRLEKQKGLECLFDAIRILKGQNQNFELFIAGEGSQGDKLNKLAETQGISDHVHFLGKMDNRNITELYHDCDVFVLPSLNEGFPIAGLEAMAAGLPVIATYTGSNTELVIDGVTGYLVRPGDTENLASAMLKLMEREDGGFEMGLEGRRLVEDKYSWTKISKEIEFIYRQAING